MGKWEKTSQRRLAFRRGLKRLLLLLKGQSVFIEPSHHCLMYLCTKCGKNEELPGDSCFPKVRPGIPDGCDSWYFSKNKLLRFIERKLTKQHVLQYEIGKEIE